MDKQQIIANLKKAHEEVFGGTIPIKDKEWEKIVEIAEDASPENRESRLRSLYVIIAFEKVRGFGNVIKLDIK